jgi:hypothetical protein
MDQPLGVTLTATDVDGKLDNFKIIDGPKNGTLTGALPNLTYTPSPGFLGTDTFTFTASDSLGATSAVATVTIHVTPP